MNIVTALETLSLEGLSGKHDHVIETVLSKLFVRDDKVHKAYKHRQADFANLAMRDERRTYIREDFFWNNLMAPEVYLELHGVRQEGTRFVHTAHEDAEDWYITMQKIDTKRDLISMIEQGSLKRDDLADYTRALMARLATLSQARRPSLESFFARGGAHVQDEVMGTRDWAYTAEEFLSRAEVDYAGEQMRRALESVSYFADPRESLSVVIDTNPENILFLEQGVSFIDVMPPKDAWRVHDRYFALCRTSADISALLGGDHAAVLHETYAHTPRESAVRMTYEIAAALIQVPYRKMVGRGDLALRYADFVRRRSQELSEEISR